MISVALLAAAAAADFNPAASDLFARDPLLQAWALTHYDSNRDGWLTSFEVQPALLAFKARADRDGDGRVTVAEFQAAKAALLAPPPAVQPAASPDTVSATPVTTP